MTSKRVLIVEDDKSIRESLIAHFEDCGFEAEAAADAVEALELLERRGTNAMVVDLRLPGASGEELIRWVRAGRPDVVFVVFTGSLKYSLPDDLERLDRVSDRVFFKPLEDLSLLTAEINRLLGFAKENS